VTPLNRSGRTQLLRASMLMLVALWITGGSEQVAATMECDVDQECEAGENCQNCPSDCGCFCGDNVCYTEGDPQTEECETCPEDCESECVCGDGYCDFPAEGGNIAWATCEQSGNPECQTCTMDCWDCKDALDCDLFDPGTVCSAGLCEACEYSSQCWDYEYWFCAPAEAYCDENDKRCKCYI
jgi:hypothetical protein